MHNLCVIVGRRGGGIRMCACVNCTVMKVEKGHGEVGEEESTFMSGE